MTLSTMEKVMFLRGVELFSEVRHEELVPVAYIADEVRFPAGTTFIRQGDLGDCCYLIVQGEAQVVVDGVGPVATRPPGSLLGEMAIILRRPRSASCVANTAVIALRINHDDFWALLGAKPALARGVMAVLAARLDEVMAFLRTQRTDADTVWSL
jgi:CRP-like cAMP-binding protein